QLEGSSAGAGANGLTIATVGSTISGLIITGFRGAGIALVPGPSTNTSAIGNDLWGNFLGVTLFDTHSSSLVPRGGNPLANDVGEAVGQGPQGGGNIISGNAGDGVHILGTSAQGNVVVNNEIGTDVGQVGLVPPIRGMNPRPNLIDGILIEDAPGNTIGGLLQ